jgi:hypothetical protein
MTISNIAYDFKAGEISSEAGSVCLAQYVDQIKLAEKLEKVLGKKPSKAKRGNPIKHSRGEKAFHHVFGLMQGYRNPAEMDRVKNDPVVTKLIGQRPSASGLSRLLTNFKEKDLEGLRELNRNVLERYLKMRVDQNGGEKLDVLHFGDDSTKIETYGKQEGSAYIHHYQTTGYHPDLITDHELRLILSCVLRDGNTYSSKGSEHKLEEALSWLRQFYKKIVFRADSAYAKPEIFDVLNDEELNEEVQIEYYIKAKTYRSWLRNTEVMVEYAGQKMHILETPREFFEERDEKTGELKLVDRFVSFSHQCNTWKKPETIVARVRWQDQEQQTLRAEDSKDIEMILVTSDKRGEEAFQEYGKRGKEEQIIEEVKNDSFAKTLSHREHLNNACELQLKILAHNVMQILRLEGLKGTGYAKCRTTTLRRLLVQVGGKVVRHGRQLLLKLSSCFAYQRWFELVMGRIPLLSFRLC